MNKKYALALTFSSLLALSACGGSSGSGSGSGSLSVSLTDAPVDEATNVFVTIRGISLNFEDGGWVDHDFDTPQKIDLLTLQSGNTFELFPDDRVEAGEYKVRLNLFEDDDGELDNYIVIDETSGEFELFIPSGDQTGLKLDRSIVVPVNGIADYTIDFDVRKSVILRGNANNNNGYLLKPKLRLVNNSEVGTISGVIDTTVVDLVNNCSDEDPLTHNVVYIYEGDVAPDDYGSSGAQAVTTANVTYNENSGVYSYSASFLTAGDYTIGFTCNADLEDIEADDELSFLDVKTVTVVAESSDNVSPVEE